MITAVHFIKNLSESDSRPLLLHPPVPHFILTSSKLCVRRDLERIMLVLMTHFLHPEPVYSSLRVLSYIPRTAPLTVRLFPDPGLIEILCVSVVTMRGVVFVQLL